MNSDHKPLNTYDPDSLRPENRGALAEGERAAGATEARATDDAVLSQVKARLLDVDYFDESKVHVSVAQGHVTLRGEVPDQFMKQAVDDVLARCEGVDGWDNQLTVTGET